MANHDEVPTYDPYRVLTRMDYEQTLQRVFGDWLRGKATRIEVLGVLGVTAAKWGDNAQTRAISAAVTEWDTHGEKETGVGQSASAGKHVSKRR